uniref:Uncharacterized protein n=1 Tax=Amphimedon queenslandica TaxID=400682 RepID=A0A1X7V453_AMPQE
MGLTHIGGPWTSSERDQLLRIAGSIPIPHALGVKLQQPTYSFVNGQQVCDLLHQQERRYTLEESIRPCPPNVGVVSKEKSQNSCRTYSRHPQSHSRCGIQETN